MFSLGSNDSVFLQNLDVMLDGPVLKGEFRCELIQIARAVSDFVDDPGPVLATSRPTEKVPEEPSKLRVVRHSLMPKCLSRFIQS